MSKLKEIFISEKKSSVVDEIKKKLNVLINQEDADFSDFTNVSDRDNDLPPFVECLKYFVTGQVCKNLRNFTTCEVCRFEFFFSDKTQVRIEGYPITRIITLNQENQFGIQHPYVRLFNFLTKIETSFAKHCNRSNAFELVVRDVTEKQLEYPCSKHASDVYAYLITYYLQNRMRQFAKIKMADIKKDNLETKKAAKLTEA